MIITIVCDVLGEENNGTTIAAMNLIRYLKEQGHTVRVLCADQDKKDEKDFYVVPQMSFGKVLNNYVSKIGVSLAKPNKDIIKSAIENADLVHIMIPLALGIAAAKIARELNIPITAGFHMQAENLTNYLKVNKLKIFNKIVYKFIYKKLYKYVDAIHYPTKFIKDVFESNIKKQTNGYVISNGVNAHVKKREVEKPNELKDKIVILSTGRYAREKSQDTLIKAIKYSKYKDKIQLIFAGQGIKEKYYKKLSKNLPIAPIFKLFSRNDIIDAVNYSDLYVHPADVELEGIACLEAICCGKLTIVSDSKLSATKDFVVDEKCIFKHRNAKSLAKVIDFWLDNPTLKREYEERQLNYAKVYSQKECMEMMEQMILEVVKNKEQSKESTRMVIKKCLKCGSLVEVIEDCKCSNCGIKCCNSKMVEIKPNTVEASIEKHKPQFKVVDNNIEVIVNHVMEEKHYIEWIALETDELICKKFLKPNQTAKVTFPYIKNSKIYAYCNLHGLWETEIN